ncbi:hypothetical protein GPX31_08845 [Streptococcus thermophilus]|nr:hypothetical protein [Streptococcus thermophilus]MCE2289577.1 hypothetical protein [Streptococcus thermophilus]MCE2291167.1 hypothetical protein [Streptococcus thermophilus]MCE2292789.1 hypothetical protein [Streptococcus thermophilus]MCE2296011.1 hypothetical protein [Streptococcus thermophilus]
MNILDILGLDTIWSTMESRRTKRNKKKSVLTLLNWGLFVVYSVSAVFLAYSLDNDLVTCVASDMHNLSKRKPYMQEAFIHIEKEYGRDRAWALFKKNPLMLLKN